MVRDMSTVEIFFLIIFEIVTFIGFLGNGFIVAVNGHQWFQSRKMTPSDVLLTILSTSRIVMQLGFLINSILHYIIKIKIQLSLDDVIFFSWIFSDMTSHWCATWLSAIYCVKVANFASPLFLWLKARINRLAPRLLGLSVAVFTASCFPLLVDYFGRTKWHNLTETWPENATQREVSGTAAVIFLPIQIPFYVINLCLSTIAITLLLLSLWRHTRSLKESGVGVNDLSTQVHIKVMAFLLFWFLFYFVDFIAVTVYSGLAISTDYGTVQRLLIGIWMSVFPSAHSIILILTNPKLKETCIRLIKEMYTNIISVGHSTS